jgi:hypothetical protein
MTIRKKPQGNPQGKGAVPVLDALGALQAWQPEVKSPEQILREFCLSTLVLSARFDFRVVPGNTYYLYHRREGWQLSLISPGEWGDRLPGSWVARCELATDMTWAVELAPEVADNTALLGALEDHLRGFIERINDASSLEAALPTYEQQLPYQQRMMATALSSSLQTSLILSGLSGQSGKRWLQGASIQQFLLSAG